MVRKGGGEVGQASSFDLSRLDPDLIVDINIFSDRTRDNWRTLAADWATKPPFYVINFGVPQVIAGRHADVRTVYMQPELFTQKSPRPKSASDDLTGGLPALGKMEGEPHRRLRSLLSRWFNAAGVDQFEPAIREETERLIDELEAQGNEVDVVSHFSDNLIPRILLKRMCGLNEEQQNIFLRFRAERDVLASVSGIPPSYVEAFNNARAVVEEIIEQRRKTPQADFIGGLVVAHDSGEPISYEEIIGNLFLLFFAAVDSTSIATTVLLYTWMRNRDQFQLLQTEPELIWSAIEEALRLHPTVITGNLRFATEEADIAGTLILQGMPVLPAITAANLDPTIYPDPLRFDIRRDPKQVMTFGTGPHYCMGAILAQRIMAVSLRSFMRRFPNLRLIDPDFALQYGGQIGELSPRELPVRLV